MFAMRPGPDVVEDEVILRLEPVGLCATACERIQHDNFGSRLYAHRGSVLSGDKDTELVDDCAGICGLLRIKKLIFAIAKVRRNFGQIDAANPLVLYLQAAIMKPDGVGCFGAMLPVQFKGELGIT